MNQMDQIAKYHNSHSRRKSQYNKRYNGSKVYAPDRQMKMKRIIISTLRNQIRENPVSIKSHIMIQKGDHDILIWNPDPTTRKMLDCMRENNFKGIIEHMDTVGRSDYSAIVDFCKCLETAVVMMRLIANNSMRKMTLEDYQQGLFDIIQAAGALADNPRRSSGRHDLENGLNTFLRKLESHVVLTELLKEHGETEEDLDKRMSASLLKF